MTLNADQLQGLRREAASVTVSDSLLNYVQRLIAFTRERPEFALGLSPRGALALMAAARTWAVMENRSYVIPEDVQQVLAPVVAHRVLPSSDYAGDGMALVGLLERSVDVVAT
jgi:MoxR-like ATPase